MPSRNAAQIPGKLNIAADYLSRYHLDKESPANVDATTANVWLDELSPLYIHEREAWSQFELVANALTSTERHQAAWFGMNSEQSSKLLRCSLNLVHCHLLS